MFDKNNKYLKVFDKKVKAYMVISTLLLFVIQGMALIPPVIMKQIIDKHIPEGDVKAVIYNIVIFISIPLIVTLINAAYNYKVAVFARKLGKELTVKTFHKLIKQPLDFYKDKNSSELTTQCNREFINYITFWIKEIPLIISSMVICAVIIVIFFKMNPILGIIQLFFIPCVVVPHILILKKLRSSFTIIFDKKAEVNELLNSSFRNISFIKTMQLEKNRIEKFRSIDGVVARIWGRIVASEQLVASGAMQFFESVFTGVGFIVGAVMIIKGQITLGVIVSYLSYLPRYFSNAELLVDSNYNFKKQLVEYEKAFEYLKMDYEFENEENLSSDYKFENAIALENVNYTYKEKQEVTLNNVSMRFEKNKWTGLVGKSGSGKSTVFNLLLSLYQPVSGSIKIDEIPVNTLKKEVIRKNITRVAQETCFFDGTIKENLSLVNPNATDDDIKKALALVELGDFIESLEKGIDTQMGEAGSNMSGGERQRMSLAQGLLRESDIILLDEVTSNVDKISEEKIKGAIKNIINNTDKTVISISHSLEFLAQTDYMYVMDKGEVIDEGLYKDIKKRNQLFFTAIDVELQDSKE
jgi:ABC-type bacteriocin/lantibiotic exporter with double-glycine peptidase domain